MSKITWKTATLMEDEHGSARTMCVKNMSCDHFGGGSIGRQKSWIFSSAEIVNAVENRDYFGMMSAPDFMSQMSVTPAQVSPEDGYFIPSAKKEQSFQFDESDLQIASERGQSLKLKQEQSLKLDTDDYLKPI